MSYQLSWREGSDVGNGGVKYTNNCNHSNIVVKNQVKTEIRIENRTPLGKYFIIITSEWTTNSTKLFKVVKISLKTPV